MSAPMQEHLTLYLRHGFSLLPLHRPIATPNGPQCSCERPNCSSPGKHPFAMFAPHGLRDASSDEQTVRSWFESTSLNVGIATGAISGIIAVDIDPRHDGDESLAVLEAQFGPLPQTCRFLTGGGGEHILFRHPGTIVPNSAGKLGPGIDVRGDGGYIVAPPSKHALGRGYAISVDHHPDDIPLAEPPPWLLNKLARRSSAMQSGTQERPIFEDRPDWRNIVTSSVPDGQRNQTTARIAGYLLRNRIDPFVALTLIQGWNRAQCVPPLSEYEVERTVRSIASRELERRRS